MPWLARGYLIGLCAVVAAGVGGAAINLDVWLHLRIGQEFLNGWKPWDPGSFSAHATNDWVSTQWLSQVALAQLESWWGLSAIRFWGGLWALVLVLTLFLICRRFVSASVALCLVTLTVAVMLPWMSARPQMFSYLLALVTLNAWLSTWHDSRLRWWLLGLFWIWPQLHGMWPLGLVLSGVAVVGLWLDGRLDGRRAAKAMSLVALCCAVTLATPVGPRLAGAVLLVTGRGEYFTEWAAPTFTDPKVAVAAIPLVVVSVLLSRSPRTGWFHILLFLTTAGFMVYALRMVPLTLLIGSVLLCHVLRTGRARNAEPAPVRVNTADRATVGVALAVGGILLAVQGFTAPSALFDLSWARTGLDSLPPGSTVLTDRNMGAHLIYQRPALDVPVQGYLDLLDDEEVERVFTLETGGSGWLASLTWLAPSAALVQQDSEIYYNLTSVLEWRVVARDQANALLFPPDTDSTA